MAARDEGSVPDRFAKFTGNARRALFKGQEVAIRFKNNYNGTEHLLLGLLDAPEGVGTTILTGLGVDLARLRVTVEGVIPYGHTPVAGEIGLTPRAKKVIDLAVQEARFLGHHYVGQEHLLLGMVQEGEGVAWGVLSGMGVTLDRLRSQVLELLARGLGEPSQTGPKNIVVTCRITDEDAQALDDLVEAGVRSTRSDAAAWLIRAGIEANAQLLETVRGTVFEIRRLRQVARALAQQVSDGGLEAPSASETPTPEDRVPPRELGGPDAGSEAEPSS